MDNNGFPKDPQLGQTHIIGFRKWKWDGTAWICVSYFQNIQTANIVVDNTTILGSGTLEDPYRCIQTTKYNINKSWGAIGHSIWAVDNGSSIKGIQTHLNNYINFTDYYKYAYSGYNLAAIVGQQSNWNSCDIYTLDTITNDFKTNYTLGTISDFENKTGTSTYYGALAYLHTVLFQKNPKYRLICSNALKRNKDGYTSWSQNTKGHSLDDYSNALQYVAKKLSWFFIDQFQNSGINEDNLLQFTSDGLHPNNDGYERYWRLWYQKFLEI